MMCYYQQEKLCNRFVKQMLQSRINHSIHDWIHDWNWELMTGVLYLRTFATELVDTMGICGCSVVDDV